jgi:hypothetical protein
VQQRKRKVQLLAGATRQLLDAIVDVPREAELVEQGIARRHRGDVVKLIRLCEQFEVLRHRELVPEQWLLRAIAEPSRARDAPAFAREQANGDLHQGALARSVLAHEADQLAGADFE